MEPQSPVKTRAESSARVPNTDENRPPATSYPWEASPHHIPNSLHRPSRSETSILSTNVDPEGQQTSMYRPEREMWNMGQHEAQPGVGIQAAKRRREGTEDGDTSFKLPRWNGDASGTSAREPYDEARDWGTSEIWGGPEQADQQAPKFGVILKSGRTAWTDIDTACPKVNNYPALPPDHPNYARTVTKQELNAFILRHPYSTHKRHELLPRYFGPRGRLYMKGVGKELIEEWFRARDDIIEAKAQWPEDMISETLMANCVQKYGETVDRHSRLKTRGVYSGNGTLTLNQRLADLNKKLTELDNLYLTEKRERERRDRMLGTLHGLLTGDVGEYLATSLPGSPTDHEDRAYAEVSKLWLGFMDEEPGDEEPEDEGMDVDGPVSEELVRKNVMGLSRILNV
ncbi:hypothetical protein Z517_09372 [Fonsecaea pedrosoi CBS 271.37]|uniref:Uncharacterized protein n=1 Tax=Fonsecaea pedrosoi CBS 271.37 TaxID=1442368 RepID=A0A0D2G8C2_9EURO|nr:uncharacterized protein Z517_09372 [Fonsecaea pedrosoi CBS 271.37]KIW76928.1 hypothetical protein Z517_09372 [Fonsecaea pedrosoi CBS 271.37]